MILLKVGLLHASGEVRIFSSSRRITGADIKYTTFCNYSRCQNIITQYLHVFAVTTESRNGLM